MKRGKTFVYYCFLVAINQLLAVKLSYRKENIYQDESHKVEEVFTKDETFRTYGPNQIISDNLIHGIIS